MILALWRTAYPYGNTRTIGVDFNNGGLVILDVIEVGRQFGIPDSHNLTHTPRGLSVVGTRVSWSDLNHDFFRSIDCQYNGQIGQFEGLP